jgi:hypothetical protein
MKRILLASTIGLVTFWLAALGLATERKPKAALLTGTWECVSHGGPQGDMNFTLYLEQNKEAVTGTVSSPLGSTELTSATFKKNNLEIHIDTDQRNYLLTGRYKNGQFSGEWSTNDDQKGTWEGKKSSPSSQP